MADIADRFEPDITAQLRVLYRRKWLILGLAILGLVGAGVYAFSAQKVYSATATVLVQSQKAPLSIGGTAVTVGATAVVTQIQLLESSAVQDVVKKSLGIAPKIVASQIQGTDVIAITDLNPSPARAVLVANTYASDFITYERQSAISNLTSQELQYQQQINTITTELGGLSTNSPGAAALGSQLALLKEELAQLQIYGASTSGGLQMVSSATTPKAPVSPKKPEDLIIGLVVGLLLGILLAYGIEYFEDAIRSREDLERMLPGTLIVGMIPMIRTWKDERTALTISMTDPSSVVTEAYRSLRSSLQFASYDDAVRAILITSPTATVGKTSTVANLGVVFANSGQNVVIVSTDLRRPRLGQFFNMDESVGITSVVIGDSSLSDALQAVESVHGLYLLGVGPIPPNPSELLASKKMADIMAQLRENFDVIIVDSPPTLPVTDPVILAQMCDLTLLVVASGQTKKTHLKRAYGQLEQVGVERIGLVFNEVQREADYTYGYSYNYSYKPHPNGSAPMSDSIPVHEPVSRQEEIKTAAPADAPIPGS
jgi:capsular exopolysaccharide synthesis family protein